MKDHIGPDDVIVGDPNQGTEINTEHVFPTGKSASQYKQDYGNHLPWFMVKEIVGDDIWNNYLKITIERDPFDRFVSLFCFLNPALTTLKCKVNKQYDFLDRAERKQIANSTPIDVVPEQIRAYFQNWVMLQLEADVLPLTDHTTYGAAAVPHELERYRQAGERLDIDMFFYDKPNRIMLPMGTQNMCDFPPFETDKILLPDQNHRNENHPAYKRYLSLEGQCRFLNYGYYHDGEQLQVDHVLDFRQVADNLGKCFEDHGIDIKCNKELYDNKSQNVHFRKKKTVPDVDWWYDNDVHNLKGKIKSRFETIIS